MVSSTHQSARLMMDDGAFVGVCDLSVRGNNNILAGW